MTKTGRLSNRDMAAIEKAYEILSEWTQIIEDREGDDVWDDYVWSNAMNAVAGLCEFVNNYEHR
jgi:hypothetical protein